MGAIASTNRDPNLHEVYPSEAVAVQAKLRQAALAAHPVLVRKLPHTEAYGGDGTHPGLDWYPAGISPWYLDDNGVIVRREVLSAGLESGWMDRFSVTKGDLHRSAILIQKTVRGHQARGDLHRRQRSAKRIQRRFRQWRAAEGSASSLSALSRSGDLLGAGTLCADTWSANERDEFEFLWKEGEAGTWNQNSSLYDEPGLSPAEAFVIQGHTNVLESEEVRAQRLSERKKMDSLEQAKHPAGVNGGAAHAAKGRWGRGSSKALVTSSELGKNLPLNPDTRDANVGRKDGRDDMYPAMAPGPLVRRPTNTRTAVKDGDVDGLFCTSDGVCGVRSMILQNAEKKWFKPPKEQRVMRTRNTDPLSPSPESRQPRTSQVTQPSATETVCPVKSVDSVVDRLSPRVGGSPSIDLSSVLEGSGLGIEITPELVQSVQSLLKAQLTTAYLQDKGVSYLDYSVIKPSDVEFLLRAAEFRNDIVRGLKHLTTSIRLDYYQLMDDIEKTQFYAAQQVEAGMVGYQPQRVVLISSTIPKCEKLKAAVRPDVLAHVYDFSSELEEILDSVKALLDSVRPGAKAKNMAIVCKGGPGHFYLVKKTPVTPAKLRTNEMLLSFWQGLGALMSKLVPGESVIHLMESNMAGNKQGERLLLDLEAALYAHQVKVICPLELSTSGKKMINLYFDPTKYKLWKMTRYTKLQLF